MQNYRQQKEFQISQLKQTKGINGKEITKKMIGTINPPKKKTKKSKKD